MSRVVLKNEDCLVAMDRMIEKGIVVDAVICDPPYGTTACRWDSVIDIEQMWLRLNKLIKPSGAIVLFGGEPFSSRLRMSNIKNYKYDWYWYKNNPTGISLSKTQPMRSIENVLVFCDGKTTYNKQLMDSKISDRQLGGSNGKHTGNAKSGTSGMIGVKKDNPDNILRKKVNPRNVLEFKVVPRAKGTLHPTQKPVLLMDYLIKTYTNEGELVLDFTMGSGTTGVSCKNLNRDFIGIELDEKYFEIAKDRIGED